MILKRASTFIAAALLIALAAIAAVAQVELTREQRELADYIKDHYTKREVYIPMRDSVKLFAVIYEPKDKNKKYPIMFDRTP
jgi:predicted acyl esterase